MDDVMTRSATSQWSYELYVLESISRLATQHNVFNCVAIVTSEKVYSTEGT
jgi:hypothetical protein